MTLNRDCSLIGKLDHLPKIWPTSPTQGCNVRIRTETAMDFGGHRPNFGARRSSPASRLFFRQLVQPLSVIGIRRIITAADRLAGSVASGRCAICSCNVEITIGTDRRP